MRLRSILAAALLVVVAEPADAQRRSGVAGWIDRLLGQADVATADTTRPARYPPDLKPCGELYNADVLRIAQGPELAKSSADWLIASERVVASNGGLPLPVCFEFRQNEMVTSLSRFVVAVNESYMTKRFLAPPRTEAERRFLGGYLLTGYTDPLENDTVLARERAEWVQTHSPLPVCRYRLRTFTGRPTDVYYRKVYYSYLPAVPTCPRAPS